MTDRLERDLADVFGSTAGDADVPHLPLHEVVARGRLLREVRRRRAARWTAVAVAAAVVAVCVPIAVTAHHGGDQRPAPAHRTSRAPTTGASADPSGTTIPTSLPYLADHVLHLDGQAITTRADQLVSHGGTTLVWRTSSQQWWQVRDGHLETLGPPPATTAKPWTGWGRTMLSPDGTAFAVLTHPTQDTSRVTAYDARTHHELGHVDLALPFSNWTGGGDSVGITGIDDSHQVFWYQEGAGKVTWWMWRPGSRGPVRLDAELDAVGVAYPPMGALTSAGDVVTVAASGTTTRVGAVPDVDNAGALWSPTGAFAAIDGADSGPSILRLDTGAAIAPDLSGGFRRWLGFESDADVLGVVDDDGPTLVRCATATGACATVAVLPHDWADWRWATTAPAAIGASSPSSPPASSTSPSDSGIAMIDDGVLTLRGTTLAHDVGSALEAGTTILVVRPGKADTSAYTVDQISATGAATPIPALGDADGRGLGPIGPVLSPDGTIAVGVDQDGSEATLTEWSLTRHRVLGRTRVPGGGPETLGVDAVDDHGRVYATTYAPRSGFTWLPGHPREPMAGAITSLWGAGFDTVGPDGILDPPGCAGQPVAVAPDGGHVLCLADSPSGFASFAASGAGAVPLKTPAPKRVIGFESATAVLVVVSGTDGAWLVRCSVTDGSCRRAMPVPAGATFPRLSGTSS